MTLPRAQLALQSRNLPQALTRFRQADPDAPETLAGLWQTHALLGNLPEAWQINDRIRALNLPDEHRLWTGAPIAGRRLIVRSLHGLGDAVQLLRFAPRLAREAAHITWELPPALLPLAPCFPGVQHAITWGDQAPEIPPTWDLQLEITELPYLLRLTLADLPPALPYLHLQPSNDHLLTAQSAPATPRIGLVWAAGDWNPTRSIPLALFEPILNLPNLSFLSLQGPAKAPEAHPYALPDINTLLGPGLIPLAAAIAQLDLVLTVDTLAAHLAGAQGRPVWLLLEHAADWRWLHHRADSPWYPTMRLFRQPTPGDWPSVLAHVRQTLKEHFSPG